MPTQFWTKPQDHRCVDQYNELTAKLEALGKVVDDLSAENGKLREELLTRSKLIDNDMSEMESRLITRIEDVEDRLSQPADYSSDEAKTGDSLGGYDKWSERKRSAIQEHSDPTIFTDPQKFKERFKKKPEEKK